MPKQETRLITPNSKISSNIKFNELIQHTLNAWDTLISVDYTRKTLPTIYTHLINQNKITSFQAIIQWFSPLDNPLLHEKENLLKTIEWTIQLLIETQIHIMRQPILQLQRHYIEECIIEPTLLKKTLFLLGDYIASIELYIKRYQKSVLSPPPNNPKGRPKSALKKSKPSLSLVEILKEETAKCLYHIKHIHIANPTEYFIEKLNKSVGNFIQRLMIYQMAPDSWGLYKAHLLELNPPPIQLHALIEWLRENQCEAIIPTIEYISHQFIAEIYHSLKENKLESTFPLLSETQFKIALNHYIEHIKSLAGIQEITVSFSKDKLMLVTINTLNALQLRQAEIEMVQIIPEGYLGRLQNTICSHTSTLKGKLKPLKEYSDELQIALAQLPNQIEQSIHKPSSLLHYQNIENIMQTILDQGFNRQPLSQTAHLSSQAGTPYTSTPSSSISSMNLTSLFTTPLSEKASRLSPLYPTPSFR